MVGFLTAIGAIGLLATAATLFGAFGLWGDRAYVLAAQVAQLGLVLGAVAIGCLAASHALATLERIAANTARRD